MKSVEKYQYLLLEKREHVATVTINRPKRRNALNKELLIELEHVAISFRDDTQTRVVIFTGSGAHFSAGADLDYLTSMKKLPMLERRRAVRLGERVFHALLEIEQITICAWNGAAIGGAACLATAMDLRIGAKNCFIQYPEIDLGMNVMWQCLPRTTRLVGEARAIRLAIGGERVEAQALLNWGLSEQVVPCESLLTTAQDIAAHYASKPPIAVQMIKRSINATGTRLDRAMMHADSDQHVLATLTADHEAALSAYLNNAKGHFVGD